MAVPEAFDETSEQELQELLRRARLGDRDCMGQLYNRLLPLMRSRERYLLGAKSERHDREDLRHDVWIAVVERIDAKGNEIANLRGYISKLYRTKAGRFYRERVRKQKLQDAVLEHLHQAPIADGDSDSESKQRKVVCWEKCLSQIKSDRARQFCLLRFQGHTNAEASKRSGFSPGRGSQIVQSLKSCCERCMKGAP